jgi:kumamolisin
MVKKLFPNSVVPMAATPGLAANGMIVNTVDPSHRSEIMPLHFSLALPKALSEDLEKRVAKGEVVSPDELNGKYIADSNSATALVAWLKGQGFDVTHVTPDHTSVYAKASIDKVEKSLGVHMIRVTHNGLTVTAASDVPGLPEDVGEDVQHIGGLQPFLRAQKHFRRGPANSAKPAATATDATTNGYLVAQILQAYEADNLGVSGRGQEIAILIDTFPQDGDLTLFWQINGIDNSLGNITKINVNSATLPPVEGEESLDAEWTSGVAPGAGIRIYASGGLDFSSLDLAIDSIIADAAVRPGLRQMSVSLGLGELYLHGPSGEIATQHQKFLRLAAAGVNVFVSSGDAGSNPGPTGHASNGALQPEYAAADSSVIGVGGTSLSLNAAQAVASETAWAGSGGGKSHYFPRPAWQTGASIPAGSQRLVPDVSLTADPGNGALLVLNGAPLTGGIGGTSWSTPVWAGFCALINEARVAAGKAPLGFLPPFIYPLMGTRSFRDVTEGSNGAYHAGPGYDLVTGIGVPNLKTLMASLPEVVA